MTHIIKYKTILNYNFFEIPKIKGSRFIGHIMPIINQEEIKTGLTKIKNQHGKSTHNCYVFFEGINCNKDLFNNYLIEPRQIKGNDDGEPNGTATYTIKNIVKGEGLQNILLVVTRYYGGTLLGIGGLIDAYGKATKEIIKHSTIIEREIIKQLSIKCDVKKISQIINYINKRQLKISKQEYTDDNKYKVQIDINIGIYEQVLSEIKEYEVNIK